MARKHVAAAFIAVSLCAALAASCVQSIEDEPIETKDDDGDVGSDPDTSGSIGGVPAWDYNWSPPTCDPSAGDGDSDPDPPPDTGGGYSPSPAGRFPARPPVRPPAVMPLAPCEHECQTNYEKQVMIEHTTTFTPADGSAPRTITLRIGDSRSDAGGDWTVAVEVLGFEHDTRSRLMQVDWPHAIRDAARFIAQVTTDCVELAGGGTLNPPVYPPDLTEKKKKRRKAKKDHK